MEFFNKNSPNSLLKIKIYAFLVDLVAIAVIKKALVMAYMFFLQHYFFFLSPELVTSIKGEFALLNGPLFLLIFFSYFFFSYYSLYGKTLGLFLFDLSLQSTQLAQSPPPSSQKNASPSLLSFSTAFRRSLGHGLNLLGMGIPSLLFKDHSEQKSFVDWFSGSRCLHPSLHTLEMIGPSWFSFLSEHPKIQAQIDKKEALASLTLLYTNENFDPLWENRD